MSAYDINAVFYSDTYHPIQAGSIDGTDTIPHDHAVYRALISASTGLYDPMRDAKNQEDPHRVIFIGRLARETTESTLEEVMSKYGRIKKLCIVRDIVTGASRGYAFVEYETEKEMQRAYEAAHQIIIDGHSILVDYNRQVLMPGWIPRRLGGGLGGRKESGQLRFGGRDRPFRKPLRPIPDEQLRKLGIPLPGNYMQRFEVPPLPKRRSSDLTRGALDQGRNRSAERRMTKEHLPSFLKHEDLQTAEHPGGGNDRWSFSRREWRKSCREDEERGHTYGHRHDMLLHEEANEMGYHNERYERSKDHHKEDYHGRKHHHHERSHRGKGHCSSTDEGYKEERIYKEYKSSHRDGHGRARNDHREDRWHSHDRYELSEEEDAWNSRHHRSSRIEATPSRSGSSEKKHRNRHKEARKVE